MARSHRGADNRKRPARPLPADPQRCKPGFFGECRVRDAQPRRDQSGRIEREGKVGHHAAINAIANVIYGPPDGHALLIVLRLQHGSPPTALLAHAMNARNPREDMRIASISAEFLGPIRLATMHVRIRVARAGRRMEMLEGVLESDGREIVLARAWRIAVQRPERVPRAASARDLVPGLPSEWPASAWLQDFGCGEAFEWRFA
jgi:hypothetical protein